MQFEWKDAFGSVLGNQEGLVLDNVPVFPVHLVAKNEWGKTTGDTERRLIDRQPSGAGPEPSV